LIDAVDEMAVIVASVNRATVADER